MPAAVARPAASTLLGGMPVLPTHTDERIEYEWTRQSIFAAYGLTRSCPHTHVRSSALGVRVDITRQNDISDLHVPLRTRRCGSSRVKSTSAVQLATAAPTALEGRFVCGRLRELLLSSAAALRPTAQAKCLPPRHVHPTQDLVHPFIYTLRDKMAPL